MRRDLFGEELELLSCKLLEIYNNQISFAVTWHYNVSFGFRLGVIIISREQSLCWFIKYKKISY